MPVLASVLAFLAFSLSGYTLEPGIVFASLTLFMLLRLPLMFLRELYVHPLVWVFTPPIAVSLSAIADASNATHRLYDVFVAETFEDAQIRDTELDAAVEVKGATFTWDSPPPEEEEKKRKGKHAKPLERAAKVAAAAVAAEQVKIDQEKVFKMPDLNLSVPRGALVAIVGAVRQFCCYSRHVFPIDCLCRSAAGRPPSCKV
jgi:ABC-type multidrug transport system fused ATPase/permease subunit